jgi:hypothetical protein
MTRAVFFLGHGRQGTTLGSHLFAQHIRCFNLIESTREPAIDESVTEYKRRVARALRDPRERDGLVRYFTDDPMWREARRSDLPVVCKFPYNTLFLPLLEEVFPGAVFIHISRFPPDTVTSLREVFRERRAFAPVREHPVFAMLFDRIPGFSRMTDIARWAWSIRTFAEILARDARSGALLMTVRFEDLVDPASARTVLEEMVDFSGARRWRIDGDLDSALAENANRLYGCSGGDHPTDGRVGRFARELVPSEADEVASICRSLIDGEELYQRMWSRYASERVDG